MVCVLLCPSAASLAELFLACVLCTTNLACTDAEFDYIVGYLSAVKRLAF